MLDKLGLGFAAASLLLGGLLLYDAVSVSDLSQTIKILAGAVLLALGLVTASLCAKDWWQMRNRERDLARSAPYWPSQD